MRRFLVIALILVLLVTAAGSVTGNVVLYVVHRQEQAAAQGLLDVRSQRISGLEQELGTAQTRLRDAERQIATLQAQVANPPVPTPTPPTRPVVLIVSPSAGDQFQEGEEVIVRWNVRNPDRVERVIFVVDGRPSGEADGGGEPWVEGEFVWTAAGPGRHWLEVIATNPVGLESDPARLAIEVVPVPSGQAPFDPEVAAAMTLIEQQVVEIRGLETVEPVTRTVFTREELRRYILDDLDQELPSQEAENTTLEMAAFDFLPADTELRSLLADLYTEQIAGFYDPDTRSFTLIDEDAAMGPLDKATYAHEFTHALQDQHYGLDALDPDENTDDASLAVTALIEGDAMLLMQEYVLSSLEPDELFELLSESMTGETEALDRAPAVIQAQMMFPYEEGLAFVQVLHSADGYRAVDEAFVDPPRSTEQILHPERYLAGEQPQVVSLPPLTDTLGAGWRWVDANVLGEFTLRLYLEQWVGRSVAEAAADGWGGDWYAVYVRPATGDLVMVLRIIWDTAAEAAEFGAAYRSFAEARFGSMPVQGSCWSGSDAICLSESGDETLIIRAPSLDLAAGLEKLLPNLRP